MRQIMRLISILMALVAIVSVSSISLVRMIHPRISSAKGVLAELKFAGAYNPLSENSSSVSAIFERANPAVVRITATHVIRKSEEEDPTIPEGHPDIDRERRSRGIGTGCIIDEAGYI